MLLSVENLRKTFSGTPVLHGIDLEVEKGGCCRDHRAERIGKDHASTLP